MDPREGLSRTWGIYESLKDSYICYRTFWIFKDLKFKTPLGIFCILYNQGRSLRTCRWTLTHIPIFLRERSYHMIWLKEFFIRGSVMYDPGRERKPELVALSWSTCSFRFSSSPAHLQNQKCELELDDALYWKLLDFQMFMLSVNIWSADIQYIESAVICRNNWNWKEEHRCLPAAQQ